MMWRQQHCAPVPQQPLKYDQQCSYLVFARTPTKSIFTACCKDLYKAARFTLTDRVLFTYIMPQVQDVFTLPRCSEAYPCILCGLAALCNRLLSRTAVLVHFLKAHLKSPMQDF